MGHKVPPLANRLGLGETWNSRWFAKRQLFGQLLEEDIRIRRHLSESLRNAAVARVEIERTPSRVRVLIHSARPGIVIGRRGADIDRLRDDLYRMLTPPPDVAGKAGAPSGGRPFGPTAGGRVNREIVIDIKEVKNPAIEPQLVAENVAFQLERQIGFRRAMKRAIQLAMSSGALGVRIRCAGRLGGSEMSRVETYREGKLPLGTFRANIGYGFAEARTTYGRIGAKCWVHKPQEQEKSAASGAGGPAGPAPPVVSPARVGS